MDLLRIQITGDERFSTPHRPLTTDIYSAVLPGPIWRRPCLTRHSERHFKRRSPQTITLIYYLSFSLTWSVWYLSYLQELGLWRSYRNTVLFFVCGWLAATINTSDSYVWLEYINIKDSSNIHKMNTHCDQEVNFELKKEPLWRTDYIRKCTYSAFWMIDFNHSFLMTPFVSQVRWVKGQSTVPYIRNVVNTATSWKKEKWQDRSDYFSTLMSFIC